MRARVFKLHIESGQVYCGIENKTAEIYFAVCFLYPSLNPCNTCIGEFVSNMSPKLLHLGFCNLVQML